MCPCFILLQALCHVSIVCVCSRPMKCSSTNFHEQTCNNTFFLTVNFKDPFLCKLYLTWMNHEQMVVFSVDNHKKKLCVVCTIYEKMFKICRVKFCLVCVFLVVCGLKQKAFPFSSGEKMTRFLKVFPMS